MAVARVRVRTKTDQGDRHIARCLDCPTWEGAIAGGNVSAKSPAKFGSTSFEYLNRKARSAGNLVAVTVGNAPPNLGRFFAAEIMKSKLSGQKNHA